MLTRMRNWFESLSPRKRLNLIFACGFLAMVASVFLGYSLKETPKRQRADAQKQNFILPTADMAKESWLERGEKKLENLERELREAKNEVKILKDQVSRQPSAGSYPSPGMATYPDIAQEREAKLKQDLSRLGVTPIEKGKDLYPPSPVKPAIPGQAKPTPLTPEELGIANRPPSTPAPSVMAPPPGASSVPPSSPRNIMGVFDFTSKVSAKSEPAPDPKTIGTDGTNYADVENFYTPGGSFFKIQLLTGLDAPSGPSAQGMPHPVLVRIQDLSWLPNELRQNVTGCFLLTESYGDLATERAYMRGLNLSCVNREDQYVLDEQIIGFVADSDGKLGMRGRVVSKQGQWLARALWASFIEGVAKGFDTSVNTTVISGSGVVTTNEIDSFGEGFKKGMASGFSKAANKLSDFYLKSAEQLYPVIEINAKRHATFILTEGKRFSFNKQILIEKKKKEKADELL